MRNREVFGQVGERIGEVLNKTEQKKGLCTHNFSDTGKIYPLFDAGELHNPAVQRAFQYLMLWESGQSLDHLQFVPGQVAGGQTKCLEVLLR